MSIADSGKVELTGPQTPLRDLSDPVVREQIADQARRDAKKSVRRLLRRMRVGQAR